MKRILIVGLMMMSCLLGMGQLFQQQFSTNSGTLLNASGAYTSAPYAGGGANAFDRFQVQNSHTITSDGSLLAWARTGNSGIAVRSTNLAATAPTSLMVRFDYNVTQASSGNSAAQTFYIGNSFGTSGTSYSGSTNSSFVMQVATAKSYGVSANNVTSGSKTILWVSNSSGSSTTYKAPDGTYPTLATGKYDIWIGTTKDVSAGNVLNSAQAIQNFAIAFTGGSLTFTLDNLLIDPIPPTPTVGASSNLSCSGFRANWGTASGVTGYRIDVATDAGFTSMVSGYNNLYVSGQATSYLDITGLSANTTYYYRVRGASQYTVDEFASGNSSTTNLTTSSCATPNVTLNSTNLAVIAGSIAQGSSKNPIYKFSLAVAASTATVTGINFTTGGDYASTDVTRFQLWYKSADDFSTATQIGSDITATLGTGPHSFSGISQAISAGSTGYFWITANVASGAIATKKINVSAVAFGDISYFSSVNNVGTSTFAGGDQTIVAPGIIASSSNPAVAANAAVYAGTTSVQTYAFWLTPSLASTLNTVSFTTSGSYLSTDISKFQLYFSTTNDINTVVQLGADISSGLGAGSHSFTGLGYSLSSGTPVYFWILVDASGSAGSSRTLTVSAIASSDISVSTGSVGNITTYAGGVQTFVAGTSLATDYFRSKQSGTWETAGNWESSANGSSSWVTATLTPNYQSSGITIYHSVTTNANVTVDQVTIENGGIWEHKNASVTVNDGTGDDIIVKSGGVLKWGDGSSAMPTLNGNITVQSGGKIEALGNYDNLYEFGTNSKVTWNDASVFEINNTGSSSAFRWGANFDKIYFPNAPEGTSPILRFTKVSSLSTGSNNNVINGKIEFNNSADIGFNTSAPATVRDGIIGSGTGISSWTNGVWTITGVNAVLGGTNIIQIGAGHLTVATGAIVTLISNKTLNINTGGTFKINGTLICGTNVISGSANFTLNAGGTIKTAHSEGIAASSTSLGSVRNSGTRSFSTSANYEYNGSVAQNSGDGLPAAVNDLTINNSANVSSTNGVTLTNASGGTAVNGILYLTDGIITTSSTLPIIVNNTASTAIVRTTITDETYVNGPIKRYILNGSSNEYLFPTGKNTGGTSRYKPTTLIPVNNSGGRFDAEYFRVDPPLAGSDVFLSFLTGIDKLEYWQFDRGVGSSTGKLRLPYVNPNSWRTADGAAISPCAYCNVAIVKRTTSSGAGNWDFTGSYGTYSATIPEFREYFDAGDITTKEVTSFSPFTFGFSFNTLLPVRLLGFEGKLSSVNNGQLEWAIADNRDLAGFELQYSRDGRSFNKLAAIAPGNSTNYSYQHARLQPGNHFYRLVVNEKSGKTFYSNIVLLTVGKLQTQIIGLRENPVYSNLSVTILSAVSQTVNAQVIDGLGRRIMNAQYQLQAGQNQWLLPVSSLSRGLYFLQVNTADGEKAVIKFMKD